MPINSETQVAQAEQVSISPLTSGARIYVVRDIPEQARALQQVLSDARYLADVFSDFSCLRNACLQQGWPQLLLIDLVQAELENAALSMLKQLRAEAPPPNASDFCQCTKRH